MTDAPRANEVGVVSAKRYDETRRTDAVVATYQRYHGFVWRSLRALGLRESEVDDALQEVFIAVHRRWETYDPSRDLRAWLYGIARMKARQHHREHARGRQRSARLARVTPAMLGHQPALDPQRHLEHAEAIDDVQRFLDSLDPEQREVFALIDIEGMRGPEVATLLDVKLNTVYSRLRLARARFERLVARRESTHQREVRRGA